MSSSKTGGRKRGTPNKNTQELIDLADRLGVNPFAILLHFASGNYKALDMPKQVKKSAGMGKTYLEDSILPEMRLDAAYKASQFMYPKRKAVEVQKESSGKIEFVTKDEFNEAKD